MPALNGVSLDKFEMLECVEHNGVIRKLVRKARIIGMNRFTDYRVLKAGLNNPSIPQWGSLLATDAGVGDALDPATDGTEFGALVLVDRQVKVAADNDKSALDLTLTYEHFMDGPYQYLYNPPSGMLFVKGRSSITQRETNFYRPRDDRAFAKTQILVSHTFPFNNNAAGSVVGLTLTGSGSGYTTAPAVAFTGGGGSGAAAEATVGGGVVTGLTLTNAGGNYTSAPTISFSGGGGTGAAASATLGTNKLEVFEPDHPGQTFIQGGEIKLPFPQSNVVVEGVLRTNDPWAAKRGIHRKINSIPWLGEDRWTWICSDVEFEIVNPRLSSTYANGVRTLPDGNPVQRLYRFKFEFQHDPDTWDPVVTFIDKRTGLPPSDIKAPDVIDPATGVMNRRTNLASVTHNPAQYPSLPAGYWAVPALAQVDFNNYFSATFPG